MYKKTHTHKSEAQLHDSEIDNIQKTSLIMNRFQHFGGIFNGVVYVLLIKACNPINLNYSRNLFIRGPWAYAFSITW